MNTVHSAILDADIGWSILAAFSMVWIALGWFWGRKAKALDELGVEWKEVGETLGRLAELDEEDEPTETKEGDQALLATIKKELGLDKLSEFLEGLQNESKEHGEVLVALTKVVAKLAKNDDEKIAEQLTPKVHVEKTTVPIWLKALSRSDDTEMDEDDEGDKELIDSKPTFAELGDVPEDQRWITEVHGGGVPDKGAVPK